MIVWVATPARRHVSPAHLPQGVGRIIPASRAARSGILLRAWPVEGAVAYGALDLQGEWALVRESGALSSRRGCPYVVVPRLLPIRYATFAP